MHQSNDKWLYQAVERLKQDDIKAFDILFYKFESKIFNFSFKLTHSKEESEEVVQEVFLKVWEKRSSLRPEGNFESYIFTIAKNIAYNKARDHVYELAYKEYAMKLGNTDTYDVEKQLDLKELELLIQASCQKLPPVRRKVFMMSRFGGLTNDEIAETLNTSTSNIKNHIYKALIFLKEHLRTHNLVRCVLLLIAACL